MMNSKVKDLIAKYEESIKLFEKKTYLHLSHKPNKIMFQSTLDKNKKNNSSEEIIGPVPPQGKKSHPGF